MEAHASVMPPFGVTYPLIGLTVTMPCAPLPAGTLLGAIVLVTVIVYCGVTPRTVIGSAGVGKVVVGPVPVIVTPYATVLVSNLVVTVTVAVPGADTAAGL